MTDEERVQQVMRISKGNPGAVTVGTRLLREYYEGNKVLDTLEELELSGPDIWVGYKDYCGRNLVKFANAVLSKDQDMLSTIIKKRG